MILHSFQFVKSFPLTSEWYTDCLLNKLLPINQSHTEGVMVAHLVPKEEEVRNLGVGVSRVAAKWQKNSQPL